MTHRLLIPLALCACAAPPTFDLQPFRAEWERAALGIPIARTPEGAYDFEEIRIGGSDSRGNFNNRGDVVVQYIAGLDEIQIDVRKFTSAATLDDAQRDYEQLELWLHEGADNPAAAAAGDDGCDRMWHQGCGIRAHFAGRDQKVRSGMDLRVRLPADFLGKVIVETDDLDEEDDYPKRANVCLWDLPGSADVLLDNGQAVVKMAPTLQASPSCPVDQVATCDAMAWSNDCPCVANGFNFGRLEVTSRDGKSPDIAVQTPSTAWARIDAENASAQDPDQTVGDALCTVTIDIPNALVEATDSPQEQHAEVGRPAGATPNGGYGIRAFSDACAPVSFIESPDMFVPGGTGTLDRRRGDIVVCENCILNASCEDFLQDGLQRR